MNNSYRSKTSLFNIKVIKIISIIYFAGVALAPGTRRPVVAVLVLLVSRNGPEGH